jgi:hypothetical protein
MILKIIAFLAAAIPIFLFVRSIFFARTTRINEGLREFKKQANLAVSIFLFLIVCVVVFAAGKLAWTWWSYGIGSRSKCREMAAFRTYGLVSVCGNWRPKRDFGPLSPRTTFWCLVSWSAQRDPLSLFVFRVTTTTAEGCLLVNLRRQFLWPA